MSNQSDFYVARAEHERNAAERPNWPMSATTISAPPQPGTCSHRGPSRPIACAPPKKQRKAEIKAGLDPRINRSV